MVHSCNRNGGFNCSNYFILVWQMTWNNVEVRFLAEFPLPKEEIKLFSNGYHHSYGHQALWDIKLHARVVHFWTTFIVQYSCHYTRFLNAIRSGLLLNPTQEHFFTQFITSDYCSAARLRIAPSSFARSTTSLP